MVQINRFDVVQIICKRTVGEIQSFVSDIQENELVDAFVNGEFVKRAKYKTLRNLILECGATFKTKVIEEPITQKMLKNYDKRASTKRSRNILNDDLTMDCSTAADKGFGLKASWNFSK